VRLRESITHALLLSVQAEAAKSIFQLCVASAAAAACGVGVFFQRGLAVTADHNLTHAQPPGSVTGRASSSTAR